ncbi:hypothetical protein GQ457_03G014130 [Hibiscus cannabinus]
MLDFFEQLGRQIHPIPAVLAETFISLNACRKLEGIRFRGCANLLQVWALSHFWKIPTLVLPNMSSLNFSPLREFLAKEWPEIKMSKWVDIFKDRRDEEIVWRVPWLGRTKILYKCGDYDYLMLLGVWGGIGCAPLLVSRQFVHVIAGLNTSEFEFLNEFRTKVQIINDSWKHCYFMGLAFDPKQMFTPDYDFWRHARVNDKLLLPSTGETKSLQEHLKVVPSEADILRNELKRAKDKIEALQTKHGRDLYDAGLDVDKARGETEQLRKMYDKLEKKYMIQNAYFLKFQTTVRNADLRKTPKQWEEDIKQAVAEERERGRREVKALLHGRGRRTIVRSALMSCNAYLMRQVRS